MRVRCFYLLLGPGRIVLLLAMALLTGLLAGPALRVEIEQDNASMVATEPGQQLRYQQYQASFGSDNLLLLGLQAPDLFTPKGLGRLAELSRKIAAMPGIERVFSLSNAKIAVPGRFGTEGADLLPSLTAEDFSLQLATRLRTYPRQFGRLLSADQQTAALLAVLAQPQGHALQQLVDDLRDLDRQLPDGNRLFLTGVPVQKADVARAIQRDQRVIIPLSVTILGILLLLLFRRPLGLLLPLAVMGISLTWTVGLYSLAGLQLNTVTALLPPVIMVLAVATSVHLLHGWLELAGERGEVRTLLAHRMATLFTPCMLTALTTAIGLFSLNVCDIPAVRSFGLYAGIGTLIAFTVAITLIPVVLSWLPIPARKRARPPRLLRYGLRRIVRLVHWQPGMVLLVTSLLTAFALPGLWQLRNNTDLVRFFRPSAPLHADTLALDASLGGVENLELVIQRKDGKPLDALLLQQLAGWQQQLTNHPQVTGSLALPDLLTVLWRAEHPASKTALPDNDAELLELYDLLAGIGDPQVVRRLVSDDLRSAHLSVQLHLLGSASAGNLGETLVKEGTALLGSGVDVTATGGFLLMSGDSNRLVISLLKSFGLSLTLVLGALYATFRSWSLLLVALAPNLIPLLWTGGLMGWFGIDLNTGTAMIAAVTIGLVVDDTIHFLHRYRREQRGYTPTALIRTTLGVGPALVISTLVLTLGFWVGAFGSFLPTVWFSFLTGATLIGALLCDLLVLPAALLLFDKLRRATLPTALVVLLLFGSASLSLAASLPQRLQDNQHDLPVRSVLIPAEAPHVGSLKLLKRERAVILQTDLATTLLRRVLAAIARKEQKRWPSDSQHHAAMLSYLEMLTNAGTAAERQMADRPAGSDRRRRLQIEFVAEPPHYHLAFYLPDGKGTRKLHSTSRLRKDFCFAEIKTILADLLKLDAAAVDALLIPLLPPGTLVKETP